MAENQETDLKQIGLTAEGQNDLDAVMRTGWFDTKQDAYRLAIAVALANDVIATPEQIRDAETRFNFVGGVDSDGRLRSLIGAFRPQDAHIPARVSERLAHAGLAVLARKLAGDDVLLSEALGLTVAELQGTEKGSVQE